MRNLLTKATGTAIAIAAAALLNSGSANAQALVIDDLSCKLFDSAMAVHTIFPPALGGDAVVQRVMTPSGNSKITCSGRLPAGADCHWHIGGQRTDRHRGHTDWCSVCCHGSTQRNANLRRPDTCWGRRQESQERAGESRSPSTKNRKACHRCQKQERQAWA